MSRRQRALAVAIGLCFAFSCSQKKDHHGKKNAPEKERASKPEKERASEPDPAVKPVEKAAPPSTPTCPTKTTLTAFDTQRDISAAGPFELETFEFAKAVWLEGKTQLAVYISNQDWPAATVSSSRSPVKNKGDAILELRFFGHDTPIAARAYGKYDHSDETKTPYVLPSISVRNQEFRPRIGESRAEIIEIGDGTVCGSFELRGSEIQLAGTFLAETSE